MKPSGKTCKGCFHLIRNLHIPTGHKRLFCCLSAHDIHSLRTCPRERLHLIQEANQIKEAEE